MPEPPYPVLAPWLLPAGIVIGWPVTPRIAVAVDRSPSVVLVTPGGPGGAAAVRSEVPDPARLAETLQLARLYVAAVPRHRGHAGRDGPVPPDGNPAVRHEAFLALASASRIAPAIDPADAEQRVSDFILDYAGRYPRTGFPGDLGQTPVLMSLFARTWDHHPERHL